MQYNDLMQFFATWPRQRDMVIALTKREELDPELRAVLEAMVFVVDNVGPKDMEK